jgi:hypothetical protein
VSQRVPARQVARVAAAALRDRRARRLAAAVGSLYLLIYLVAIGDLVWAGAGAGRFARAPSVEVAADWTAKLLAQRAPFAYEPVLAVHPVQPVTLFVAPADLAMGLLLAALVGLNLGLALLATRTRRACGVRGAVGLLGALPALAGGVTCCVPTLALALGGQLAGALLAVGGYLFPVALLAVALPLVWNAHRLARVGPAPPLLTSPGGAAPR